jgi:hypothetical protein
MWELVAGLLVALAALALVLEPLVVPQRAGAPAAEDDFDLADPTESDTPKVRALLALREIEFDRATGKLSEDDYRRLKAKYESEAIAAIRAEEAAERAGGLAAPGAAGRVASGSVSERAEELIRRARQSAARTCPTCGPRPEPNAVFCSHCGRSLLAPAAPARCRNCGAPLADGAKFCAQCGGAIAA